MSNQRPSGFTLVDLAASIVALGLLTCWVLPAASAGRGENHKSQCMSRLGALAQACVTYALDDQREQVLPIGVADEIPAPYTTYYGFGGKSGLGTSTDEVGTGSPFAVGALLNARRRPLNAYVHADPIPDVSAEHPTADDFRLKLDAFHCPGDAGFAGMHFAGWKKSKRSSYDFFGTSYITNPLYVGATGTDAPCFSNGLRGRAITRVQDPMNTVMIWENAALYAIFANREEKPPAACAPPQKIGEYQAKGWHGDAFNFNAAFGDGSVRYVVMKGHTRPAHVQPIAPTTPPICEGAACDCLLVRGPNWQLDAFPAAAIATQKHRTDRESGLVITGLLSGSDYDVAD